MANLVETSRWEAGIYQLETSDPVMGGPNGIDNRPLRELANRTVWLKNEIAKAVQSIGANKTAADQALALKANAATLFTAGAGLTGGGSLAANRSFALATPSTLSGSTTNWAGNGATGHTHELAKATPTVAGVAKLINNLTAGGTDAALSAEQGKVLAAQIAAAVSGSLPLRGALSQTQNLDELRMMNHTGVWHQTGNAFARADLNYPVQFAGVLLVLPSAYQGMQIYIPLHHRTFFVRHTKGAGDNYAYGDWLESGGDKLANSGQPNLDGLLKITNTGWEKIRVIQPDGSYWRVEFNPSATELSANFNNVNGSQQTYIWFPAVTAGARENVAYQSWVRTALDNKTDLKTVDYYADKSSGYKKSGFYRSNLHNVDDKSLPSMEIHIVHPSYQDNQYARGIGFDYGGSFGLTTTAWDKDGVYVGQKTILTEENGVMLSGNQTVGGTKTFAARTHFSDGLTISAANTDQSAEFRRGAADWYWRNPISGQALQLKDNGDLAYQNRKIYHEGNKPGWNDIHSRPDVATRGTTLAHYGITDSVTAADFQWASLKPGTVMYFAGDQAPHGWLAANGAAVSRAGFPHLFAAIGTRYGAGDGRSTFNLPDLRGEFVRSWDAGRGVDSGRALGSWQGQNSENHWHPVGNAPGGEDNLEVLNRNWGNGGGGSARHIYGNGNREQHTNALSGGNIGSGDAIGHSGENRPRNIALLACIKA